MDRSAPRSARRRAADAAPEALARSHGRIPAAERRRHLIEVAADVFAEHGFEVTTRAIAAAAGVTQALLYKHFAGKDELVTAVIDHQFADRFRGDWAVLTDPAEQRPFAERLAEGYVRFARGADRRRLRLFVRAGLDGRAEALRRGSALTTLIFEPVIAALRREAALDDFSRRPMLRGERELAMMLHGAVVFMGIRKFVYGMRLEDDPAPAVEIYVRTFWAGALSAIRDLHALGAGEPMALTQLRPGARRAPRS